jgi:hypothetical protein
MARRVPIGMGSSDYYAHGDSLLEWTPPDVNWMAPPTPSIQPWLKALTNPTYRLVGDKSGWPSADLDYTGDDDNNQDLPDAGHTFVYPIYHWGNAPGETINRYLATNVEPDDNPSNIGWTTVNHPTYTTNPNLYPHFSVIEDPYDLREDEEGKSLYQILVGRTQIPTSQVKDREWFWL